MKKILKILQLVFSVLTLAGGGYVLYTGGEASPGYAIIPLAFAITCGTYLDMINKTSK